MAGRAGPGKRGQGPRGEGHGRSRGSAARPGRRCPRDRALLTVSEFRSLPGASAVREDIFSGSRGTGRPGGGGQGCRGPLFPSPPAGLGTRAQKLGAANTRVHAAGEGAGRGREGDAKGPSGPAQWGPRAPWGRPAAGRRTGGRGPGRGRGAGPGGGGGRRWRGREGRDVRGRGGQGGAAETPPPAAGP